MMTPHRAIYHKPAAKHVSTWLALGGIAWLILAVGVYLFGVGALTLLEIIGGVLS